MGKTHRFTNFIASINVASANEANNVTFLVNSDSPPEDFTPSEYTNGHIFVPNDKGVKYTQMVSSYTSGIDSNFSLDYSYYPSNNGVLLLGGVIIYYNDTVTPVAISNPANLMILKDFGNHKLTGNFSIKENNKPGLTIVSGYDKTNNNNSIYYNVTSKDSNSKNNITDTNEFDKNTDYNFELTGDSSLNSLTLNIKKNIEDEFSSSQILDRNNNSRIGFLANNNMVLSNVTMDEYP